MRKEDANIQQQAKFDPQAMRRVYSAPTLVQLSIPVDTNGGKLAFPNENPGFTNTTGPS